MDGHRQRSNGGRRRRRKPRMDQGAASEPILIVARRPNSPLIGAQHRSGKPHAHPDSRRGLAPRPAHGNGATAVDPAPTPAAPPPAPRRSARIVQVARNDSDERERLRERLLARLMASSGRGAISRAADEYREAGFDFPREQEVQLQLLEHFDEERARDAIAILTELLQHEPPMKKPVFEQRLRRLEEYADERATREAAANLRRGFRA